MYIVNQVAFVILRLEVQLAVDVVAASIRDRQSPIAVRHAACGVCVPQSVLPISQDAWKGRNCQTRVSLHGALFLDSQNS